MEKYDITVIGAGQVGWWQHYCSRAGSPGGIGRKE
jgi:hypothetical protein